MKRLPWIAPVVLLIASGAWAQAWIEAGDAPSFPDGAAQFPLGQGALTTIIGTTDFGLGDLRDAYCVRIVDPGSFLATTDPATDPGASGNFDTRLLLFESDGAPVLAAEDTPGAVGVLTTLTGVATDGSGFVLTRPGEYVLIVGGFPDDPQDAVNVNLFDIVSPWDLVWAPNPAAGAFDHWEGGTPGTGFYTVVLAGVEYCQEPPRAGDEFQVNTYTTNFQETPSVAVDSDGDFVVVWESYGSSGTDTDRDSIQGQRYDPTGAAVGSEFQVNTYTTDGQTEPSVAVDSAGDFVVVWESYGSSGTDFGASIQGQRFNSTGTAIGGQFQVNTYTTDVQFRPSVAVASDGDFVVVWHSYGSSGTDTDTNSIQGQRFNSAGTPNGGEFQVNTYTTSSQNYSAVAVDSAGDFVVVWQSLGSSGTDTDGYSVQGQRFNSTGTVIGGEFQVNTYTTSNQYRPSVAVDPDGDFVVVWRSYGSSGTDTDGSSIQGQRYDATGTAIGGEFQINTYTTSAQFRPAVAVDSDGDFVVAWESQGSSGTDTVGASIQGQRFNSTGTVIGGEFQVNTYTTYNQNSPSVAVDPDGDFVVVWESYGSSGTDTDYTSIQGQRFGTRIFTDGFESGDTSVWSQTIPPP